MNPLQQQQAVFKVGVVSEIDPATCAARVRFDDLDGLETMRLPVGVQKSLKDKSYWMPDVGEHVACLLDVNAEAGVILCAIYSGVAPPPVTDPDKLHVRFDDSTEIEYDRKLHRLQIHCAGDVEVIADGDARVSASGNAEMRAGGFGQVVAGGELLIKSATHLILKGPTSRIDL